MCCRDKGQKTHTEPPAGADATSVCRGRPDVPLCLLTLGAAGGNSSGLGKATVSGTERQCGFQP